MNLCYYTLVPLPLLVETETDARYSKSSWSYGYDIFWVAGKNTSVRKQKMKHEDEPKRVNGSVDGLSRLQYELRTYSQIFER